MQATSDTAPKRERRPGKSWSLLGAATSTSQRIAETIWHRGGVRVISSLVIADLPDGAGVGPQWHVSISNHGKRPLQRHVDRALRAFGMVGAEEDNHHPGAARHFWLPCDPAHRVDCECKTDEATVVEADGYRWTNPHDRAECRGCEFQRATGKPCTLHASPVARGSAAPSVRGVAIAKEGAR